MGTIARLLPRHRLVVDFSVVVVVVAATRYVIDLILLLLLFVLVQRVIVIVIIVVDDRELMAETVQTAPQMNVAAELTSRKTAAVQITTTR